MRPENLSDGAKSSCERFIAHASPTERERFYNSEDIDDLYSERSVTMPDPRPTSTHVAYMIQHLEDEYGF